MRSLICFFVLAMSFIMQADIMKSALSIRQVIHDNNVDAVSASEYIQDGLIMMWDGIENAGYNKHSYNTSTWVDLTGNGRDLDVGNMRWLSNCLVFENNAVIYSSASATIANTYEAVCECEGDGYQLIVATANPSGSRLAMSEGYVSRGYYYNRSVGILAWEKGEVMTISSTESARNVYDYFYNGIPIPKTTMTLSNWIGNTVHMGPFTGRIYNVRIYNRTLTPEEVAYNYEIDKARFGL